MSVEEALGRGAIGLFGERYEGRVKVYSIGEFSKEICGGPHVERTGELGGLRIVKEEPVGAGVRRVRAVITGSPQRRGDAEGADGAHHGGTEAQRVHEGRGGVGGRGITAVA